MNREQTTIRLPAELKERIQKEADEMGVNGWNVKSQVIVVFDCYLIDLLW